MIFVLPLLILLTFGLGISALNKIRKKQCKDSHSKLQITSFLLSIFVLAASTAAAYLNFPQCFQAFQESLCSPLVMITLGTLLTMFVLQLISLYFLLKARLVEKLNRVQPPPP